MLITTGDRETPAVLERAQNLAALTGATRVPRGRTSLAKLAERYGDGDILVVMEQGVRLHRAGQEPLTFHPSMGFVRAKRLLKGESDAMLEAARAPARLRHRRHGRPRLRRERFRRCRRPRGPGAGAGGFVSALGAAAGGAEALCFRVTGV